MQCPKCDSNKLIKKGTDTRATGASMQRYKCVTCNHPWSEQVTEHIRSTRTTKLEAPSTIQEIFGEYTRDAEWIETVLEHDKFVVTSAQSNTPINKQFFESLKLYCKANGAALLIIPHRYKNSTMPNEQIEDDYPNEIKEYLFENKLELHPKLHALGQLKIASTTDNPLGGLASISKGSSIIVGHNQLQLKTLPVQPNDHPVVMTTTGTISKKNYSISKQGYKAEFNHVNAAIVVELDDDLFHIRNINFDGTGFYDFEAYYDDKKVTLSDSSAEAIVTGDEHALFADEDVKNATYGMGGIVDTIKPNFIVRHDVLDSYSISHHHRKNFLTKFKKYITGQNDVKEELNETIDYIVDTTPEGVTNLLVQSNHTDHLTKWLNEIDIKTEPWNAVIYHWLMFKMLSLIEVNPDIIPDPFELYSSWILNDSDCNVVYLGRNETYKIHGIEIAVHGDIGINGSRGSRAQFATLSSKSIIGHSHSPGIEKGCYQVGTSSVLNLEYNNGPSSWLNTHCIIYKNGKRQLVNIIEGKWRA